VKFGVAMFGLSPRYYPEVAAAAEANGFESIWMPEHMVLPATMPPTYLYTDSGYPPITPRTAMYDPWVVLGAVAHATSSIRLATNVFILPLRHPFQTARSVVTLDRVSGGRVTLGIGVGWLEEEFRAAGIDFASRGRRTDEMLEAMRLLWTGDAVEFHGDHVDFEPARLRPVPAGPIPVTVGGHTRPALRRAARHDGWFALAVARDDLRDQLAELAELRRQAGTLDRPFTIMAMAAADAHPQDVAELVALGVTDICFSPPVTEPALAGKQAALRETAARQGLPGAR
jgi:probable F420-dependent oxidoreductase